MSENLNKHIKKSHIKAVEKFNEELRKWAEYTNGNPEDAPLLYEDINTPFTLANVRVEDGCLNYVYDGREESEKMVRQWEDTGEWEEVEGLDSIPDYLKFWRACLRRAKRYFAMDPDRLDRMADGDEDDIDDDDTSD